MPSGPPPKDPARRRRRNVDPNPRTEVTADNRLRGPRLPEGVLPNNEDWHPMTRKWWEVWRRSPQAKAMLATDWQSMLETALLHHVMWSKGRWEYASEVRLRVAKHGATQEDRLRLRLDVELPGGKPKRAAAPPAEVTDIASRRARLTS